MKNYETAGDLIASEKPKPMPKEVAVARLARLKKLKVDFEDDLNPLGHNLLDNSISATEKELVPSAQTVGELLAKPTARVPFLEAEKDSVRLQNLIKLPNIAPAAKRLLERALGVKLGESNFWTGRK